MATNEERILSLETKFAEAKAKIAAKEAAAAKAPAPPPPAPTAPAATAAAIKVSQLQRRQLHLSRIRELWISGFHEPRRDPRVGRRRSREAHATPGWRARA